MKTHGGGRWFESTSAHHIPQRRAESGPGLAAQRADCESAAVRLGEPPARVFTDAGVSGGAPVDERPARLDALDVIRRGNVLMVARLDRLARDQPSLRGAPVRRCA